MLDEWIDQLTQCFDQIITTDYHDLRKIIENNIEWKEDYFYISVYKFAKYCNLENLEQSSQQWKTGWDLLPDKGPYTTCEIEKKDTGKSKIFLYKIGYHKTLFTEQILTTITPLAQINANKTIIVEYSSPNIAKPFHAGHLRSTILGNYICNMFKATGANVISINYLGDWGTQYGKLAIGYEKYGNETALKENPIEHLFEIYVQINADIEKDTSGELKQQARNYFKEMEQGNEKYLTLWKTFRSLSISKYKQLYARLNIDFDVFSGESEQSDGIDVLFSELKQKDLLFEDNDGCLLVDLEKYKLGKALLRKKDGTTLYITRDLIAAKKRYYQYNFDSMFYVVANAQNHHFKQLFKILELLEYPWSSKCFHINAP